MKRRLVTVEAARAGEFLQALTALGLEAREVDRLMPVPIILTYCCRPSEEAGMASEKVVYEVEGGTRKILESLPGVRRVRSKTRPRTGPIYVRVC